MAGEAVVEVTMDVLMAANVLVISIILYMSSSVLILTGLPSRASR